MDARRGRLSWERVSSAIELHSARLGSFSLFDEANFEVVGATRSISFASRSKPDTDAHPNCAAGTAATDTYADGGSRCVIAGTISRIGRAVRWSGSASLDCSR